MGGADPDPALGILHECGGVIVADCLEEVLFGQSGDSSLRPQPQRVVANFQDGMKVEVDATPGLLTLVGNVLSVAVSKGAMLHARPKAAGAGAGEAGDDLTLQVI